MQLNGIADTATRCWTKTLMNVVDSCCMSWSASRTESTTKTPWRWWAVARFYYCCYYYWLSWQLQLV